MRLLLLLLALGLAGTAGALLLIASRGRRYLAQLASVPESSCAELTDESAAVARQLGSTALRKQVELNGTGRPGAAVLLAPFSGRPVLWYEATVTHHYWQRTRSVNGQGRRSDSRRKRSEVVSSEVGNTVPLRLDDGTGSVEVDLRDARVDAPHLVHEQLRQGADRGPVLRLGPLSFSGRTDTIGYTYRERALVEGDQLYVCGTALSREPVRG